MGFRRFVVAFLFADLAERLARDDDIEGVRIVRENSLEKMAGGSTFLPPAMVEKGESLDAEILRPVVRSSAAQPPLELFLGAATPARVAVPLVRHERSLCIVEERGHRNHARGHS